MSPGWHKPEAAVEARIALKEYGRYLTRAKEFKTAADQRTRNAVSLRMRSHSDRAEDLDRDESSWCVKQRRREHHVTHYPAALLGDER
jgi:hypothetical protein